MTTDSHELFAVFWSSADGRRHMIDCASVTTATQLARELEQAGRDTVLIDGPHEIPVDLARMAALKERIAARMKGEVCQEAN